MTTFADIAALAGNPLTYREGRGFAAILGATPSKGARSPVLWNAAFSAHQVDAEMIPIDISEARLDQLLMALDANPHFLGGAIAMPHKESVARWLADRLSPEAMAIGAVNCLYRRDDGRLEGTNTDGEGALVSFENRFGSVAGKRVLLLGLGGAGKAVAAFFQRAVGPQGRLTVCSRSTSGQVVAVRLAAQWCSWEDMSQVLGATDVLVNCTSVGTGKQVDLTPLSRESLARLPPSSQVFDIIYQPSPSLLLSLARDRGLAVLDGAAMNLEQAVLAYGYAAPSPKGIGTTRSAMEEAKKKLD
jgi:shikimate dehydrogenase